MEKEKLRVYCSKDTKFQLGKIHSRALMNSIVTIIKNGISSNRYIIQTKKLAKKS
jgi:hypothetical protein